MSNWDYIIERLSSIRPAKTIKLSDMKTDDEVWSNDEDIIIEGLVNQVHELFEVNKELRERMSFLNAELSLLQDELESSYAYSEQVEKLVPKKKLKKFWKKQREKS